MWSAASFLSNKGGKYCEGRAKYFQRQRRSAGRFLERAWLAAQRHRSRFSLKSYFDVERWALDVDRPAREWSERGRRDIDHRTRGARVSEREANESKHSELRGHASLLFTRSNLECPAQPARRGGRSVSELRPDLVGISYLVLVKLSRSSRFRVSPISGNNPS